MAVSAAIQKEATEKLEAMALQYANYMNNEFTKYESAVKTIGDYVGAKVDLSKVDDPEYNRELIKEVDPFVQQLSVSDENIVNFCVVMDPSDIELFIASSYLGSEKQTLDEKEAYLSSLPENVRARAEIARMKGLGEMDAEELNETTMDIEKRILRKITVEDCVSADAIFSKLMGDEVEPRRNFIEENAWHVENLDI